MLREELYLCKIAGENQYQKLGETEFYGVQTNGKAKIIRILKRRINDIVKLGVAARNKAENRGVCIVSSVPTKKILKSSKKIDDAISRAYLKKLLDHYDYLEPLSEDDIELAGLEDIIQNED